MTNPIAQSCDNCKHRKIDHNWWNGVYDKMGCGVWDLVNTPLSNWVRCECREYENDEFGKLIERLRDAK